MGRKVIILLKIPIKMLLSFSQSSCGQYKPCIKSLGFSCIGTPYRRNKWLPNPASGLLWKCLLKVPPTMLSIDFSKLCFFCPVMPISRFHSSVPFWEYWTWDSFGCPIFYPRSLKCSSAMRRGWFGLVTLHMVKILTFFYSITTSLRVSKELGKKIQFTMIPEKTTLTFSSTRSTSSMFFI